MSFDPTTYSGDLYKAIGAMPDATDEQILMLWRTQYAEFSPSNSEHLENVGLLFPIDEGESANDYAQRMHEQHMHILKGLEVSIFVLTDPERRRDYDLYLANTTLQDLEEGGPLDVIEEIEPAAQFTEQAEVATHNDVERHNIAADTDDIRPPRAAKIALEQQDITEETPRRRKKPKPSKRTIGLSDMAIMSVLVIIAVFVVFQLRTPKDQNGGASAIPLSNQARNFSDIQVITYADGGVYEGKTLDKLHAGQGKYTWPQGDLYVGDFQKGERTGKGKYTWPSGDIYVGDFINGKRTGKGKYIWPNGDTYQGDFIDGERTGNGKFAWTNGETYVGDFVEGSRTGLGKYTWTDGETYEGQFIDGETTSDGSYTSATGDDMETSVGG